MKAKLYAWISRLVVLASLNVAAIFIPFDHARLPPGEIDFEPDDLEASVVSAAAQVPELDEFIAELQNGDSRQVVGIYAYPVFALRVVQQVPGNPAYVSAGIGQATQFGLAARYGTTGLLAHYEYSGAYFFQLQVGQVIDLILGDGTLRSYTVDSIRRVRALNPTDPYSNFIDLNPDLSHPPEASPFSSTDLFYQVYAGGDRVVFQTCIPAYGNTSWGRLFVIATPTE